jgi:Uma2 family endonuclease
MTISQRIDSAVWEQMTWEQPQRLLELHDGVPIEKPAMSKGHGDLIAELTITIGVQLDRSRFRLRANHARLGVSPHTIYVPDVAVIPADLARDDPRALDRYDDPLPLVIEIWSPATGPYDQRTKLPGYRARGDRESWFVHPRERAVTIWRRLPDGAYVESRLTGGIVALAALPGVEIDLDALFGEE